MSFACTCTVASEITHSIIYSIIHLIVCSLLLLCIVIFKELEGKSVQPQITPPPEPKPSMPHPVAEEAAMEQLLQDNRELSRRLQDQQNIIVALRRDLAGAQARLSDLTGMVTMHLLP